MTRANYSRFQLVRYTILDLIADVRASDGAYKEQCMRNVSTLFKARHTTGIDQFGWPTVLKNK